jgi:flagellar motor switch protein FliM
MFMGEKFGRDSIWETHLTHELYKTDVQLQAILGEITLPLRDVVNWRIGTQVLLNTRLEDELELRCGHFPMFHGPVGQKQGNIAVRIEGYIPPPSDEDEH